MQHNGQQKKDMQHNGQHKKDMQHNGQHKKDMQHNGQHKKDTQWSTKHYKENSRLWNTNPTKNLGWTHVIRKGRQFKVVLKHQMYENNFIYIFLFFKLPVTIVPIYLVILHTKYLKRSKVFIFHQLDHCHTLHSITNKML
jgi:hypothetical protein